MPERSPYRGLLASPLKPGESPEDKLPALCVHLRATDDESAVIKMMNRHVIGHDVRDYPVVLRGAPRTGPQARDRVPALFRHLNVNNNRDALIKLAIRHVPGFATSKSRITSSGGRPSLLAKAGVDDALSLEAEIHDQIDSLRRHALSAAGKPLKPFEAARRFKIDNAALFKGISIKQLANLISKRKNYSERERIRVNRLAAKLRQRLQAQARPAWASR